MAEERGSSVEELVIDALTRQLDPDVRVKIYLELHEKYLKEAEELYAKGDLAQSGEKYWGAVAALLNAVAEKRGWRHYSHRDYAEIIERLSEELREPLGRLFACCERLHSNHSFLTRVNFDAHREDALRLMEMLRRLVA
ncbi:PaREP1 family protein [Pyrobaculum ferrireducens]|uniref:PaREP1 n=1 Tax=Pyrobaculum ferrireducens TaxID=1104324 RepID=G7VH23_9CREN|nr:PaREP1 family protein [Pyrobaculum ferrireducens]AET33194.1 PaREP1 [Pyrobaculum ferrireducens]